MKAKTKLLKAQNAIIAVLLIALGFISCKKEECRCPNDPRDPNVIVPEYGVSWAPFIDMNLEETDNVQPIPNDDSDN